MNGRPGPVVLVLPEDMLVQEVDVSPMPRVEPASMGCDPEALGQLDAMLRQAKRPMVIAGGSTWTPQAARDLQAFAEAWRLPVTNAFRFQDTFDNFHPQYAGDVGIAPNPQLVQRIQESDLILVLGPRLGEMTSSGYTLFQPPRIRQKLVHVHVSAEELNRVYQADLAINASMAATAKSLASLPAPAQLAWEAWTRDCHSAYQANRIPQPLPGPIDMPAIVACLQKHLPADALITNGAGNFASWVHRFFQYHGLANGLKTQLAPTSGAMGYGVPAGIGAALASGRLAFTIAGDGDFLMNGQELATAVQHGAKSIIVLLNNGSYGTIRMHQEREYPERVSGSELKNPDFAALASAYGYVGVRITTSAEFEPQLLAALSRKQGTLIEVMIDVDVITTRGTLSAIRQAAQTRQRDKT